MLLLLSLLQAAAPPNTAAEVARIWAAFGGAARAIDAGRADSFRIYWSRRPPADREAQLALATLARLRYDYLEADRRYRGLEPTSRPPADLIELYTLLGRGYLEGQRSNLAAAAAAMTGALEAARRLGDRLGEAEALAGLSSFAFRTAGVDSGRRLLDQAEQALGGRDSLLLAQLRCGRLTSYRFLNPATGESAGPAILAFARAVAGPRVIGRCYFGYSQVLEAAGAQTRSRAVLDTARTILEGTRDFLGYAAVQQFTAYRAIRYGTKFDFGVHAARTAIEYGERAGDRIVAGWALLNLAQLALRLDDARTAGRYLSRSREILEQVGDRTAIPNIRVVEGDAEYTLGRLARARAAYQAAIDGFRSLGQPYELILYRLAGVSRELGQLDEGARLLEEAGASAARRGFRGLETDLSYYRGLFALSRGGYDDAAEHFRRFMAASGGGPLVQVDVKIRLAEALALAGRLAEAERTLGESSLAVDSLRRDLVSREGQIVALQSRRYEFDPDLGIATIVAEFARRGQVATAFRIAEATRSRFLWTQMVRRGALAGDTAGPSARRSSRLAPAAADLAALQRSLPDSAAVLEFVTGRGGEPTTLFVVTRPALRAFILPPGDSLHPDILRFTTALERGTELPAVARGLAARLLDSALAVLPPEVATLAIVADGPLHRLPFDALELPTGGALVRRLATVLAPSARLLHAWWTAPSAGTAGKIIAVGDPRVNATANLVRLAASGREARQVAGFGGAAELLTGARATEAALKRARWDSARVLHLATHAVVEDQGVMSSALYLTPGEGEDGQLGVAEIVGLPLDLDLVVLSACRTLGGDVVSGEGLQGLTTPFIEAGARAVAATYWPVGDRSIVPLVTRFYQALSRGRPVVAAMREAKLATMRAGEPASVWAAFTVTGDGWVRPRLR
jgi:tetratricopeptide (TPR) repeat protein